MGCGRPRCWRRDGVLDERFTAIHGTHLTPGEIAAFAAARAGICVCRTTERDLGDGLPDAGGMMRQGVRLCVGADSHAGPDAFEEPRAIELDERARVEKRTTAADPDQLLDIATRNGYAAIGQADAADQDQVWLRLDDPALAGANENLLADAVIFGATPRAVDRVIVGGRTIVDGGRHIRYEQARQGFIDSMNRMDLAMSTESSTESRQTAIQLDGASLTIDQVLAVAFDSAQVALSAQARIAVARAAQGVQTLLAQGAVAYGITTGFGAFKDTLISPDQVEQLQRNILISHAVGAGEPFDIPTTRAIMLIRANTLARGHSGIRVQTLELLLAMLNSGIHPVIPQKGSLGASGDLAPLAHMALPIIGEGEVVYRGARMGGAEAFAQAGLAPVTLAAKEGLALTNGTSVMCALGVLETVRAERASPNRRYRRLPQLGSAARHRSGLRRPHPRPAALPAPTGVRGLFARAAGRKQLYPRPRLDQCAGRLYPALHAPGARGRPRRHRLCPLDFRDRAERGHRQPACCFFDDATGKVTVLSGGNFHGEPLAIAMDYLAIAVTRAGQYLRAPGDAADRRGQQHACCCRPS